MPNAFKYLKNLFGFGGSHQITRGTDPLRSGMTNTQSMPDPSSNLAIRYYKMSVDVPDDRVSLYELYEEMDRFDETISTALDIYAEDATQYSLDHGRTIWCESPNNELVDSVHNFLDDIDLESKITALARDTAKYGDLFEEIVVEAKHGIINTIPNDPKKIWKQVDNFGRPIGFSYGDSFDKNSDTLLPWSHVHFMYPAKRRIRYSSGDSLYSTPGADYGDSMLYAAKTIYRKTKMMDESLLLYRLMKHPDRYIYYVDVDGIPTEEVPTIMKKWEMTIKNKKTLRPALGEFDVESHPWNVDADLFWPIKPDNNSRIDVLSGAQGADQIFDVEYMNNKKYTALRINPEYMGIERGGDRRKSLSEEDSHFARLVRPLQRALLMGVQRLVDIHLSLIGVNVELEKNRYDMKMNTYSYLEELSRSEVYEIKMSLVDRMVRLQQDIGFKKEVWIPWVLNTFAGLEMDFIDELGIEDSGEGGEVWDSYNKLTDKDKEVLKEAISENEDLADIIYKLSSINGSLSKSHSRYVKRLPKPSLEEGFDEYNEYKNSKGRS